MGKPKFDPDWVVSPGALLREWREENNVSARVTATACSLAPEVIEGLEAGTQRLDADIADRLAYGTSISRGFWLNMERIYREGLAAGKKKVD